MKDPIPQSFWDALNLYDKIRMEMEDERQAKYSK